MLKEKWIENYENLYKIREDGVVIRYYKNHSRELRGNYRDWETDRKSTRLNSSHSAKSRMPSSA